MAKRVSLFPGQLDTNANHDPKEGLEVDRQPEDRYTSDAWDLMEDAILKLERKTIYTVRSATLIVAANDSSARSKAQTDYLGDGTADDVQIQAALDALPT